jgi:hypothetical protein
MRMKLAGVVSFLSVILLARSGAAQSPPEGETGTEDRGSFTVEPYGYIKVQGSVVEDDPNVAFVGRADGVELQNARVGVAGALGQRVRFQLSADGAVDERDQVNDPNGTLRVALRDAFVDLRVARVMALRAGRAHPVFDPEEEVGDTRRAFVERALPSRGVRPTDGWETPSLSPGRSLGVAVRHDPGTPASGAALGYELGAQNGADEFSSDNDNDALALSAALFARLPDDGFLLVAGRWNPRTEGELPFQQDETDVQGAAGAQVVLGWLAVGGGFLLERTSFETTGGPAEYSFGAWGQSLVRVPVFAGTGPRLDVGYRFGFLEPSDLVSTDRLMEHTAGLVLGVPSWHLRALLNGTLAVEQDSRKLDNNRIELALEVSL